MGIHGRTGKTLAAVVTMNQFSDGELLPDLLDHIPDDLDQGADGCSNCYDAMDERCEIATVPPRKDAKNLVLWQSAGRATSA